jgi:predicted nucleotidyltransferase
MVGAPQKIVQEIVQEYKDNAQIIGIRLLGSVGRGEERPNSDVDIEIIKHKGKSWNWEKKEKYGIHIDFVISAMAHLSHQFENYPYLCFIDLDKKILYDSTGFLKDLHENIKDDIKNHPKVSRFWNQHFNEMKKEKSKGMKQRSLIELFDEAERLFSGEHKVTRDWFRG